MASRDREAIEEAARELARGVSQKETATKLGVHRTTVRKWCSDPDFLEAFEAETLRLTRQIHARVLNSAERAMRTLDDLMESADDRTRLGAAKAVLTAVGTTRPEGLGEVTIGKGAQTVIVMGTPEGDAAIRDARARVMEARAAKVLPREAGE